MGLTLNARDIQTKYGRTDSVTPLTSDEIYTIQEMARRSFTVPAIAGKIKRPRAMVREIC